MQSTGFFDKNVVKNHQFTPACSLNVYLALTPTPHPQQLRIFFELHRSIWLPQIITRPEANLLTENLQFFLL